MEAKLREAFLKLNCYTFAQIISEFEKQKDRIKIGEGLYVKRTSVPLTLSFEGDDGTPVHVDEHPTDDSGCILPECKVNNEKCKLAWDWFLKNYRIRSPITSDVYGECYDIPEELCVRIVQVLSQKKYGTENINTFKKRLFRELQPGFGFELEDDDLRVSVDPRFDDNLLITSKSRSTSFHLCINTLSCSKPAAYFHNGVFYCSECIKQAKMDSRHPIFDRIAVMIIIRSFAELLVPSELPNLHLHHTWAVVLKSLKERHHDGVNFKFCHTEKKLLVSGNGQLSVKTISNGKIQNFCLYPMCLTQLSSSDHVTYCPEHLKNSNITSFPLDLSYPHSEGQRPTDDLLELIARNLKRINEEEEWTGKEITSLADFDDSYDPAPPKFCDDDLNQLNFEGDYDKSRAKAYLTCISMHIENACFRTYYEAVEKLRELGGDGMHLNKSKLKYKYIEPSNAFEITEEENGLVLMRCPIQPCEEILIDGMRCGLHSALPDGGSDYIKQNNQDLRGGVNRLFRNLTVTGKDLESLFDIMRAERRTNLYHHDALISSLGVCSFFSRKLGVLVMRACHHSSSLIVIRLEDFSSFFTCAARHCYSVGKKKTSFDYFCSPNCMNKYGLSADVPCRLRQYDEVSKEAVEKLLIFQNPEKDPSLAYTSLYGLGNQGVSFIYHMEKYIVFFERDLCMKIRYTVNNKPRVLYRCANVSCTKVSNKKLVAGACCEDCRDHEDFLKTITKDVTYGYTAEKDVFQNMMSLFKN